ncbi:MAG: hypothetical protein LC754_06400 [Acidobacteria bacterium]|nr:hypothetical protein [Acidobacteriota bacterium]
MRIFLGSERLILLGRKMLFYSTVVLCFGLAGLGVGAQAPELISRNPPVIKYFSAEKNETTIETQLFKLPSGPESEWAAQLDNSTRSGLKLTFAQYKYAGGGPARPRTVTFTFLTKGKYTRPLNYSISAEKVIIHQGEVSVEDSTSKSNGRTETAQILTLVIPTEIFLRMAQAKKVEFQVGPNSYKLDDYQRKCLAALAGTIEKPSE